MKNFLIHLFVFLSVITISCKKEYVSESTPDDNPFKITTLTPLADAIPYQSLGSGKILFERKYDQLGSLFYIIDVDKRKSSGFRLKSSITQPYLSPKGDKIACSLLNSGDSTSTWNIYVMNTDGSDCFPAFKSDQWANYPTWNNDGSKILYYTSGSDGRLYMQSPVENSSDRVEITKFHYDEDPTWVINPSGGFVVTPAGNLVGNSNSEKLSGIIGIKPYMGKAGVSVLISPTRDLDVATPDFRVESPVLSPDGTKIAFLLVSSNSLDPGWISLNLFTMDPDGNNLTSIGGIGGNQPADICTRYVSLCWSPDQTKVLFALPDGEKTCHLYVVNLDGSGYFQVTNQLNVFDCNVSWVK